MTRPLRPRDSYLPLLAGALLLAVLPAPAAVKTWDGAVDTLWDTGGTANWTGQTWAASDDALFNGAGVGAVVVNAGGIAARVINFGAGGYTLTGGVINLASADGNGGGKDLTVAGNVSIANNITMTGGTSNVLGLSIGGTGVLDYAGVVTSYNGRMDLKDTVTLNLATGSSINLTGTNGNQILFANTGTTLNLNGGSFTSTGNNGTNGGVLYNLTMNSGTLTMGGALSSQVSLLAGGTVALNGGTASVQGFSGAASNTVRFNAGTLRALASNANFLPAAIVSEVRSGGARIDTNGFNPTVAAVLAHEAALGVTADGGLFKSGEGTLTLGGANTYTGGTTVAAGAVTLSNTTAAGTAAITLGHASTGASNLRLTFSAANVANNITVAAAGSGTVTLYGNSQFSGHGGTVALNRSTILEIPSTGAATDWWYAFNGVFSGGGALTVRGGSGGTSAASSGNRVMISGANSHSGGTLVESGKLQLAHVSAAGSGVITLGSAATGSAVTQLRVGANIANAIVVSSAAPSSPAGIATFNSLQVLSGALQIDRALEINGASDRLTWSGSGAVWSGAGNITIATGLGGNHRVTHDGVANTWTGDMTINASAIFQPGHAATLGASNSLTVNGTLQLNNVPQTIDGLSGTGTVRNVIGANTLTLGAGGSGGSFSGVIQNGSGTLTLVKTGAGTQILSGDNTYTGTTTVAAGTLLVNGTHATSGLINVSAGATFGGSGSVGLVTLADGAFFTPGDGVGAITVAELTLSPMARVVFELGAPSPLQTPGNDFVAVGETLTLWGTLDVSPQAGFGSPAAGDQWLLMTYGGGLADMGVSVGAAPALAPGLAYAINVETPGQVFLTVVPEAGTGTLAALGLLRLLKVLRRRK